MSVKVDLSFLFSNLYAESSKNHNHHCHNTRNPHTNITPEERFSRLCMFLEAQFGSAITPIMTPKLHIRAAKVLKSSSEDADIKEETLDDISPEDEEADLLDYEAEEIERLHSIGIPVPGVEIKVDKHVAKVWLETLEVECQYGVLRDRVKAVVERAVETVAPLWGQRSH